MTAYQEYREVRHVAMLDLVPDPRTVVYAADSALGELERQLEALEDCLRQQWALRFALPVDDARFDKWLADLRAQATRAEP